MNRAIVPASWPGNLGRVESCGFDRQVSDDWRYVPETYEGICDWATVVEDEREEHAGLWSHRHLVYQASVLPEARRQTTYCVTIVLQGFLGDFNIGLLGNWTK